MPGDLHVLVMAGGSGTRFWPLSRQQLPKQFLPLTSAASLIAETVQRVQGLCRPENLWVLTRQDLAGVVRDCLPDLAAERLILEPEARDTAPCLVLAASHVQRVDPEALLLVLPADHCIPDVAAFQRCVRGATAALTEQDGLLTFGIQPTYPATGFGYIRRRPGSARQVADETCHAVDAFCEKPCRELAEQYLAEGGYTWNAGIFLWRLRSFVTALARHAPELHRGYQSLVALATDHGAAPEAAAAHEARLAACFTSLPRTSIDYGLMEHADNVWVMDASFPWDDVGSWRSFARYAPQDANGNAVRGSVLIEEGANNTVVAGERLVALLGVDDLVVVDTPDALLVCPRERAQDVKKLVDRLRELGREETL